jgi:hypothetical protein
MATGSKKFPFEIDGMQVGSVTVTIKIDEKNLPFLRNAGFNEVELANTIEARLQDIITALDGSVPGLVVGYLENL